MAKRQLTPEKSTRRPHATTRAYFAGIIDGEGCLNIHTNSNRASYTARLMVSMTEPRVLRMLHRAYGGSLRCQPSRYKNHKDSWYWYATGSALEKCLEEVMPYMLIKTKQAKLCLRVRASSKSWVHFVKGKKGIQHVPARVLAYRQNLKEQVNALNKTGKRD